MVDKKKCLHNVWMGPKVEVLSHYGNEHYCIVSLFKIFGISDFELIGMGDDDDDDDDDDDFPQVRFKFPAKNVFLITTFFFC